MNDNDDAVAAAILHRTPRTFPPIDREGCILQYGCAENLLAQPVNLLLFHFVSFFVLASPYSGAIRSAPRSPNGARARLDEGRS
jgi:hypothetical protein